MPNWCENSLSVSVPSGTEEGKQQLEEFIETAAGFNRFGKFTLLSFEAFVPYPRVFDELDKLADAYGILYSRVDRLPTALRNDLLKGLRRSWEYKDGFNLGGYEWCIKNWGTKWDAHGVSICHFNGPNIRYDFDTAWSPPTPVVLAMSRKFPLLHFELCYVEPGMMFKGWFECENGEVLVDDFTEMTREDFEYLYGTEEE